ncbi:MAG: S8 family serine peptidase, partial [Myxococcota bacterium]
MAGRAAGGARATGRIWRPWSLALLSILGLVLAGAAAAGSRTLLLDASQAKTLATLEAAGATTIADRGSYLVLSLATDAALDVAANAGLSPRVDFDAIHLERGPLDTRSLRRSSHSDERRLKLVQFSAPPTDAELDDLRASGAKIVQYVPQNAYLVWTADEPVAGTLSLRAANASSVQYYADYLPAYALSSHLDPHRSDAQLVEVVVQLVQHPGDKADLAAVVALADEVLQEPRSVLDDRYWNIRIAVSGTNLDALSELESVVRVEPYVRPRLYGERQGRIMSGHLDSLGQEPTGPGYLTWLANLGFSSNPADYPIVAVVDDGIDDGTTSPETDGFYEFGDDTGTSRILFSVIPPGSSASGPEGPDGHGHINASIVSGYNNTATSDHEDSEGFNYGLGISPHGRLGNVRIFAPGFDVGTGDATMVDDYYSRGARISTNSWGADVEGVYTTSAQLYDSLTRDAQSSVGGNQELLFIFANGNDGSSSGTVGSPATAKNVLSVGASETSNPDASNGDGCVFTLTDGDKAQDMASFSSRGPCNDGRIKPDIVAPGTFIQGNASQPTFNGSGVCGAASNDFSSPGADALFPPGSIYTWSSGTSHSTPGVAGYTSLITEFVAREYGLSDPSPALVKAYVLHSGTHMNGTGANENLPGNNQGFGLADMGRGFTTPSSRYLVDQTTTFGASGETLTLYGRIIDPSEEVRIALVWTDAPGSTFSNAYVNDLDLVVDVGGSTYLGNNFSNGVSQAGGTADFRNNAEAVFLPAGASGTAEITINAITIAGDGVPGNADSTDQDFALVAYNFSTVISDGTVGFDQTIYGCSDTVEVEVSDGDLSGAADFDVTLTTSEGDSESVSLSEISPGAGIFRGSIDLDDAAVASGNGILEAADAATLTATYADADDGTGSSASKQATASVDCTGPSI